MYIEIDQGQLSKYEIRPESVCRSTEIDQGQFSVYENRAGSVVFIFVTQNRNFHKYFRHFSALFNNCY